MLFISYFMRTDGRADTWEDERRNENEAMSVVGAGYWLLAAGVLIEHHSFVACDAAPKIRVDTTIG